MFKNLLDSDAEKAPETAEQRTAAEMLSLFDDAPNAGEQPSEEAPPNILPFEPDSLAETTRKSGLAWSAGIVLFGSVIFMMIIGWGADLLFGSSPWGIVGGVVLGSLIGFIQIFRISSQILRK